MNVKILLEKLLSDTDKYLPYSDWDIVEDHVNKKHEAICNFKREKIVISRIMDNNIISEKQYTLEIISKSYFFKGLYNNKDNKEITTLLSKIFSNVKEKVKEREFNNILKFL